LQQTMNPYMNSYGGGRCAPFSNLARVHVSAADMESVERSSDEIVAVIVTISSSQSYDALFRAIPQLSPEGIVAVYAMDQKFIPKFLSHWSGEQSPAPEEGELGDTLKELLAHLEEAEAGSIVFNWECCGGCSEKGFTEPLSVALMAQAIERGHMVMCSDFAVKALLSQWDEALLGPNPFITTGETTGVFLIEFNPSHLSDCCSTQLQKVGELCEDGKALLHAMAGTITFSVDMEVAQASSAYQFSLLTVVTQLNNQPVSSTTHPLVEVEEGKRGFVGHALLRYPSQGVLLLSSGHWIELSKVNTSEDSVIQAAQRMYGQAYTDNWQQNLSAAATPEAKTAMLNTYSAQIIQNCTPGAWSKKC